MEVIYNDIGLCNKDFKKSKEYLNKSMIIKEKIYRPNHPSLATGYNNLSGFYNKIKDPKKFLEYSLKALEIRKEVYEDQPNHLDLGQILYNNVSLANKQNNDPISNVQKKLLKYIKIIMIIIEL